MYFQENFPIIQKAAFDLITLLSNKDYKGFLELVDSTDMKKEESLSDFEYLQTLFEEIDIDQPSVVPYPEERFCYYERLDQKGYALDCQLTTNGRPNHYILNLQFIKQSDTEQFTIHFDGVHCSY